MANRPGAVASGVGQGNHGPSVDSPTSRFLPRELRRVVAATSFGFAVVQLDVTVVNVALTRIGTDLGAGMSGLQWVVDAYTLAFAVLLLSAGALSDRLGSRRAYLAGFLVFALSSFGCAVAPGPAMLIVSRALQGVGAAMLVPSSLALLNHATAHDSRLRARALSVWNAVSGASIAAGPVVGALLLQWSGWRSIFYVNLPLCALGAWLTLRAVPERDLPEQHRLDPAGQILAIVALTALVGSVIEFRAPGSGHTLVTAGAIVAVVASAAFLFVESRVKAPMLPLGFFRLPNFSTALAFGLTVNLSYYGVIFVLSLYLQQVRGYTALQAGLAYLPLTATFIVANLICGWLTSRVGSRTPMMLGALTGAVGFGLLALTTTASSSFFLMLPGFILIPFGMGLGVPAMTAAVLGSVDRARAGTASAVLTTARQAGGAVGVAIFGALASGAGEKISAGLHTAALISVGLLIVIAAIVAIFIHPFKNTPAAVAVPE